MSFYRSPFARLVLTGSFLAAAAFIGCGPTDGPADLTKRDTDKDGIADADDPDIDGDGVPNAQDDDVDGDGIPNADDPDFPKPVDGGPTDDVGISDDNSSGTGGGPVTECKKDPVTGEEICSCFQVQTWGTFGEFGVVPGIDGTDAITAWLNLNSTGEASHAPTKPVITADTLRPYKVLIIQNISGWAPFTAEEKAAVANWVKVDGGGIISLNGYTKIEFNEMNNVNDLLSFTGMSYVVNSDTSNEDDRSAALPSTCQDCYGNSVPQAGWTSHPIGLNIKKVGAFHGRAVSPGSATVVANNGSVVLGAAGEYDNGRVFMFHDEWVTYNSQWTGQGARDCSAVSGCEIHTASQQYTIPQFWYNSLKWLSNVACFDITAPGIVK